MKYYLSLPCVGCPWVSKGLKGQACLTVVTNTIYICPRYTGEATRHLSGPS